MHHENAMFCFKTIAIATEYGNIPERAEYGVVQPFKACQKNGAIECFTIQFHGEKRMENV